MAIEIIIRDYRSEDASKVVEVFRNSYNTLRKSKGGMHRDDQVEGALQKSDKKILARMTHGVTLVVAEEKEAGEIVGTGGISSGLMNRLLSSTYSRNHYVKEAFQRGRAGVSVGSMLRRATLDKARSMGFRKIYGFSTPESKGFHQRFGALFFPAYDMTFSETTVAFNYYEIHLRPSIWNRITIEPYFARLKKLYFKEIRKKQKKTSLT